MLLRWGFRRCEEVVWVRTKRGESRDGRTRASGMGGGNGGGDGGGDGSGKVGGNGRDGGDKGRGRASFGRRRDGTSLPKDDNEDDEAGEEEPEEDPIPTNLLVTQKEHCLVGIRGTVRRKTDGWFVHCNVGE